MSIIQFLRILMARWKLILATTLACLVVASTIVMLLPKRYPASARVLMDMRKDPVSGEVLVARGSGYLGTQIQIIQDMRVAGAVVDRLNLTSDPRLIAAYEATGRSVDDGGMREWLGQQIIDNTGASMVGASNILEITYQADNPDRAKQIVSVIRDAFVQESLRLRTDPAGRSSVWFGEQTQVAREELAKASAALSAFMTQNNIILVGGADSESAKLASLQAALQQAQGMDSTNTITTSTRLANDPVADQLAIQLATIEDELSLAGARLGTAHPTYKAIEARRNTIAKQMGLAQARSQQNVAALTGAAKQSVAELTRQVEAQSKLVMDRKPILDELVRLSQEVELKRAQYQDANSRTAQLRLQADLSEPGIAVMGDPKGSRTPSYPKVGQVMLLSGVLGFGLGLIGALIAEFAARRVRGHEDLSFASGAPVLAVVGTSPPSPLKQQLQRLLSRRSSDEPGGDLQAI